LVATFPTVSITVWVLLKEKIPAATNKNPKPMNDPRISHEEEVDEDVAVDTAGKPIEFDIAFVTVEKREGVAIAGAVIDGVVVEFGLAGAIGVGMSVSFAKFAFVCANQSSESGGKLGNVGVALILLTRCRRQLDVVVYMVVL
jgi:hypothetical protein